MSDRANPIWHEERCASGCARAASAKRPASSGRAEDGGNKNYLSRWRGQDGPGWPGLGPSLRRLLDESGMLQRDLAQAVGVTEAAVSRWVNGRTQPVASCVRDLCLALGVSADELLGIGGMMGGHMGREDGGAT